MDPTKPNDGLDLIAEAFEVTNNEVAGAECGDEEEVKVVDEDDDVVIVGECITRPRVVFILYLRVFFRREIPSSDIFRRSTRISFWEGLPITPSHRWKGEVERGAQCSYSITISISI